MISKDDYKVTETGITGVTTEQVREAHTPEEYERWCEWLTGQTCTMIDGKTRGLKELLAYSWDYERWLGEGQLDHQLLETWD